MRESHRIDEAVDRERRHQQPKRTARLPPLPQRNDAEHHIDGQQPHDGDDGFGQMWTSWMPDAEIIAAPTTFTPLTN